MAAITVTAIAGLSVALGRHLSMLINSFDPTGSAISEYVSHRRRTESTMRYTSWTMIYSSPLAFDIFVLSNYHHRTCLNDGNRALL
ncbi:hypothetical protein POJ06DRAFT_252931 [Lipomyces tetrasporus]|uniref:Uncharacterized protein n=1 Tax=Lipomyces tetrasporus TaxID=54092 RepID=A0AAD7VTT8_9ASCO|nr:uncharacterized protein POJ06DRAFT_252931 [Lipomyces tetrasporus]KAJ8100510.1 hypothetical protein POJ06DRAFT_252931 [Lipomyces tetrasporus]